MLSRGITRCEPGVVSNSPSTRSSAADPTLSNEAPAVNINKTISIPVKISGLRGLKLFSQMFIVAMNIITNKHMIKNSITI